MPTQEKDWIRVPNTHEAIITRQTFELVQEILRTRESASKSAPKESYTPNFFKGKVYCGVCGGSLHRQRGKRVKGPDVYRFHCLSNSRKARGSCVPFSITEQELKKLLLAMIQKESEIIVGTALKFRKNSVLMEAKKAKIQSELCELRKITDKDDKILKSLYENMVSALITPDEYREMRSSYEQKTQENGAIIVKLEEKLRSLGQQAVEYCNLADIAANAENTGITAELIGCLVDRIRIYPNNHIEVDFAFSSGFELLHEVMDNE